MLLSDQIAGHAAVSLFIKFNYLGCFGVRTLANVQTYSRQISQDAIFLIERRNAVDRRRGFVNSTRAESLSLFTFWVGIKLGMMLLFYNVSAN